MQVFGPKAKQMAKATTLSPFMPGQRGLLASQLNTGFGGGQQQWKGILGQAYSPMTMPGAFNYGGGAGGGNGGQGGQDDPYHDLTPYLTGNSPQSVMNKPGYGDLTDDQRAYITAMWRGQQPNFGGR